LPQADRHQPPRGPRHPCATAVRVLRHALHSRGQGSYATRHGGGRFAAEDPWARGSLPLNDARIAALDLANELIERQIEYCRAVEAAERP